MQFVGWHFIINNQRPALKVQYNEEQILTEVNILHTYRIYISVCNPSNVQTDDTFITQITCPSKATANMVTF